MTVVMPTFPAGHAPTSDEFAALLPLVAYKAVDETVNNNATLQDDDALFVPVLASATYEMRCHVFYNSGATPDIKFGWTGPSGADLRWMSIDAFNTTWLKKPIGGTVSIGTTGVDEGALFVGTLITSTTAGILQLQWAQNGANASDTKVLAGSSLVLRRII